MKYACFHCGEQEGETYEDEMGYIVCRVCGTRSVVSFQTALDLLREIDIEWGISNKIQEIIDENTAS
jgi:DNA-directed RNA polymerase subunit RPC12/RpoP